MFSALSTICCTSCSLLHKLQSKEFFVQYMKSVVRQSGCSKCAQWDKRRDGHLPVTKLFVEQQRALDCLLTS